MACDAKLEGEKKFYFSTEHKLRSELEHLKRQQKKSTRLLLKACGISLHLHKRLENDLFAFYQLFKLAY